MPSVTTHFRAGVRRGIPSPPLVPFGDNPVSLAGLIETWGDGAVLAIAGLAIGLMFGALAQRSRFCFRAVAIETSRGEAGPKLAVWLIAFAAAIAVTQGLIVAGYLDVKEARQLAGQGSISGTVIGGLMFGVGMIMARGCASRLLVLSATGNLRALVSGLILTLVAQASLRGVLSPAREAIGALWTIDGGSRGVLDATGLGNGAGLSVGLVLLAIGLWLAVRNRVGVWSRVGAFGVGVMIAASWLATYLISQLSFEPVTVKSISFTGPSADTLMGLINAPSIPLGFDVGLIPGVFAGSFVASLLARDFKLEGYHGGQSMARYITGAALMGFGSMLAGGCAVGAAVTGSTVFALTGFLALVSMWLGAAVTDRLLDNVVVGKPAASAAPAMGYAGLPAK